MDQLGSEGSSPKLALTGAPGTGKTVTLAQVSADAAVAMQSGEVQAACACARAHAHTHPRLATGLIVLDLAFEGADALPRREIMQWTLSTRTRCRKRWKTPRAFVGNERV